MAAVSVKRERRVRRRVVSVAVTLCGLGAVLAPVPALHVLVAIDAAVAPVEVQAGGTVLLIVTGFALLVVSVELSRGKQLAWTAATAFLAIGLAMTLVRGPHLLAAAGALGVLILLVAWRDDFRVLPDPPSAWRAAWFALCWFAAVVALGVAGLAVERERLIPALDPLGAVRTVLAGLVGLPGDYEYESPAFGRYFRLALLAFGIIGLLGVAYFAFRASRRRPSVAPPVRAAAELLVRKYGWDTLAYFALRPDKSYFLSSDGEAMVAYAYLNGYALVAGDPIGREDSVDGLLDEFGEFCERRGWRVAFLGVRAESAPMYRARGMVDSYLGDEAVIRCGSMDLAGREHRNLRQAVHRAERDHTFELIPESQASADLVHQLNAISERWRGSNPERGFGMTMGQEVEGVDENILLAVASDHEGEPRAFLRLVPCFGTEPGFSLDLMRRLPDSTNGVIEYLTWFTSQELARRGVERLSLNFAMWARPPDPEVGLSPFDRLLRWSARRTGLQVDSLLAFNEKFEPEWVPRSVIAEHSADLAHVWFLYAGVEGMFAGVPILGALMTPPVVLESSLRLSVA